MAGVKIDSLTELDVWVITDSNKVRTRVRRASVGTWFAQVFGIGSVPVGAWAAAVADSAGGTTCVKPVGFPDSWGDSNDTDGDHLPSTGETWLWDGNPPDIYNRYTPLDLSSETGLYSLYRTDFTRDIGREIVFRDLTNQIPGNTSYNNCVDNQGNKCLMPGWWGLWGPTSSLTNQQINNWFLPPSLGGTCLDAFVDSTYYTKPGVIGAFANNKNWAITQILNADPSAVWDPVNDTVTGSVYGTNWRAKSERTWIVALFQPDLTPPKANDLVKFNNFGLFFFEGCRNPKSGVLNTKNCNPQDDWVGRFVGLAPGTKPGGGTLLKLLRLVE